MYNAYSHENSQKIEISNSFCENRSKNCFEFQISATFFIFRNSGTMENNFRGGVTP